MDLDGNAIAGLLSDVFGTEMTTAAGECASCGADGPVAETVVYLRAPGAVVRSRQRDDGVHHDPPDDVRRPARAE